MVSDQERITRLKAVVAQLTSAVIDVYGALITIRYGQPGSVEFNSKMGAHIEEMSKRLDAAIAALAQVDKP